jgi:hypothetical protein
MAKVIKFTSIGSAIVTGLLVVNSTAKYGWWGTGVTPATAADTAPETEATESRVAGTATQQTTDHANDTYQVVWEMTCNATAKDITEAGINTASTSGYCYLRATFDALAVEAGDRIEFTAKVKHDHS